MSLPNHAEGGLLESFATASQIDRSFLPAHPHNPGDYVAEDLADVEDFMVHVWRTLMIGVVSALRTSLGSDHHPMPSQRLRFTPGGILGKHHKVRVRHE